MPGLYSHTTRATGTILTATIYNGDHQNHIDNHITTMIDDYSSNAAQMQSVASPGGVGSESLATSLAGEIERLRYVMKTMHGGAQWYPGAPLMPGQPTIASITGNITLTSSDVRQQKIVTAAADVTLPDVATLTAGDTITFKSSTEARVRLLPQGSDTIDGDTEYLLPSYTTCSVMKSAAGAYVLSLKPDYVVGLMYPGMVVGNTAPRGFLFPNGDAKSRTTYGGLFHATTLTGTVTITIASPGVITWTGNKLQNNDPVEFSTTGALPTGISAGTTYYVRDNGTDGAGKFRITATVGGSAINTSGSQSGTHTALHVPFGRGDGSTTFNVADVRGRLPVGRDALGGTAASRLTAGSSGINGDTPGATGGAETVTNTTSTIPAHAHNQRSHNGGGGNTANVHAGTSNLDGSGNDGSTATDGGSGGAHLNVQPVQVMLWLVKT